MTCECSSFESEITVGSFEGRLGIHVIDLDGIPLSSSSLSLETLPSLETSRDSLSRSTIEVGCLSGERLSGLRTFPESLPNLGLLGALPSSANFVYGEKLLWPGCLFVAVGDLSLRPNLKSPVIGLGSYILSTGLLMRTPFLVLISFFSSYSSKWILRRDPRQLAIFSFFLLSHLYCSCLESLLIIETLGYPLSLLRSPKIDGIPFSV